MKVDDSKLHDIDGYGETLGEYLISKVRFVIVCDDELIDQW